MNVSIPESHNKCDLKKRAAWYLIVKPSLLSEDGYYVYYLERTWDKKHTGDIFLSGFR